MSERPWAACRRVVPRPTHFFKAISGGNSIRASYWPEYAREDGGREGGIVLCTRKENSVVTTEWQPGECSEGGSRHNLRERQGRRGFRRLRQPVLCREPGGKTEPRSHQTYKYAFHVIKQSQLLGGKDNPYCPGHIQAESGGDEPCV